MTAVGIAHPGALTESAPAARFLPCAGGSIIVPVEDFAARAVVVVRQEAEVVP